VRLEITATAEKDLASLDIKTQKRLKSALDKLIANPQSVDLKKLKGKPERWRLRVGDWRIILMLQREKRIIYVLCIKHRREAYR